MRARCHSDGQTLVDSYQVWALYKEMLRCTTTNTLVAIVTHAKKCNFFHMEKMFVSLVLVFTFHTLHRCCLKGNQSQKNKLGSGAD